MPGPRDTDLILRSGASDLDATETVTATLTGGNPRERSLDVVVLIPSQSGTSPTLDIVAKFTDTNKKIEVTHTDSIDDSSTYAKIVRLPLPPTLASALSVVLTLGGTSPDFGAVQVWLERGEYAEVDMS